MESNRYMFAAVNSMKIKMLGIEKEIGPIYPKKKLIENSLDRKKSWILFENGYSFKKKIQIIQYISVTSWSLSFLYFWKLTKIL